MALDITTLQEMNTLVGQVNILSHIMVSDAQNDPNSELEAATISALNSSIRTILTYLDSLVPAP